MPELRMEITKIGEDRYNVFANENFTHIEEEDLDGPKVMGVTGLTIQEMFSLDSQPIGYKTTIIRK